MINLFTTFYEEPQPARLKELIGSLQKNTALEFIHSIYILSESVSLTLPDVHKIKVIQCNSRPSYDDFFNAINTVTDESNVNIIANTDIYFDETLSVCETFNWENSCMALSRWDIKNNGDAELVNRNDSQDVWIFKGKIKPVAGNFYLGVPRCDNRILYELKKAGYSVVNPSFSIKCYHLHDGVRKEYSVENGKGFVDPPYRYMYPHNLYSLPGTIYFNLTHKQKLGMYKYDMKKVNKWWIIRMCRKLLKVIFNIELHLIGYK